MSPSTLLPTELELKARREYELLHMIDESWEVQFQKMGALWSHDGNPKRPHVRFSKGGHSNGFFNSELVAENSTVSDYAASDLVRMLLINNLPISYHVDLQDVDRVVGSAMGAVSLADGVSRHIAKRCRRDVCRAYTEESRDSQGSKIMLFKRTHIRKGERVLLVEDGLTTGHSVELIAQAVEREGGIVLPVVMVMLNSSGQTELNGRRILSLVDRPLPNWKPHEGEKCLLCETGSEALFPAQEIGNWERLNADY